MNIEEIKNSTRIEEYISQYTQLKSAGRGRLVGLCPLHSEKTASFHVDVERQFFKCFGCNAGGDVIEFVMQMHNVEFSEAISILQGNEQTGVTGKYGPSHTPPSAPLLYPPAPLNKGGNLFDCLSNDERELYDERAGITDEAAAIREVKIYRFGKNMEVFHEFERYCLNKGWDAEAICYMRDKKNGRAFIDDTIEHFRYFNIKNYNEVNNHLKKAFPIGQLQRSGLYNVKEDGSGNLIFYNHRIIMPYLWRNPNTPAPGGNASIVYLRGRYYLEGKSTPPAGTGKYLGLRNDGLNLNSPKRFYNLIVTLDMLPGEPLYLVEGEFDSAAFKQLGYKSIAIPGGGNLPPIKDFKRLLPFKVTYCGDTDAIGNKVLTGDYVDKDGNLRHTDDNLTEYFRWLGKQLYVKRLPGEIKDINDFIKERAA